MFVFDAINPGPFLHSRPAVNNAKHFDADGNWGVLFDGEGSVATLDDYDMTNPFNWNTYILNYDVTQDGKNGIRVRGNSVFVAMGDDGVAEVDLLKGNVVNLYNHGGNGFANSLHVTDNYVYLAYGADGLIILDRATFQLQGQYNFEGSCNYVAKQGNNIFLANGDTDGFIVLEEL